MRRTILITCLAAATAASAAVAQQELPAERRAELTNEMRRLAEEIEVRAGARAGALETRITSGKPYTADAVTEFVQSLPDGNRIARRSTVRLSRDSEGRTRRETLGSSGEPTAVSISDPVARVSYSLDPVKRTAVKAPAMFAVAAGGTYTVRGRGGADQRFTVTTVGPDEKLAKETKATVVLGNAAELATTFSATQPFSLNQFVATRGETTKESLGEQTIEGVLATGTRTTTTIAAGAIGNELPIAIVAEQWQSTDLEVLVLTRHNDPRSGETTYRLTNLQRSEPDRSLFQVPSDYTLREQTRRQPFNWEQQQ